MSSQKEQGFMGASSKKAHICTNCKKKGHSIENCWAKSSGKEGQGPKQRKSSKFKKKKGKDKVNAAEESSSDGKSNGSVAFMNYDCVAFIKDSTGATVIIDMGASTHIVEKKKKKGFNQLKNIFQTFNSDISIIFQFFLFSDSPNAILQCQMINVNVSQSLICIYEEL